MPVHARRGARPVGGSRRRIREFNVGTWLARLQTRGYTPRATGWVRAVAGVQSLLSVYLLTLWALTYFGRPFQ